METAIVFLSENWIFIIGALLILFLFVKLVKLTVKLAVIAIIIFGVYILLTNQDVPQNLDDAKSIVSELTSEVKDQVTNKVQDQTIEKLTGSIDGANYNRSDDGSFTIYYKDMKATGNEESDTVTIYFNGDSFTMEKSEALKQVKLFMKE